MARRAGIWWTLVGVLGLTAALYAPLRSAPFVYEDDHWRRTVTERPTIYPVPGRALTRLSEHLTWRVAGMDPPLYHLGNVAIHLVNGVLVYAVSAALIPGPAAVWGAGVFLLHPLNSEAVMYLSARTDLMMTLFVLAAVWLALQRLTVWTAMGMTVAGLFAAGSKEIGLIGMPLVALTLLRWRSGAVQTRLVVSVLAVGGGAVLGHAWPALVGWFEMSPLVGGPSVPWREFLILQTAALWHLLALVVPSPAWLHGFSIDHDVLAITEAWRLNALVLTAVSLGVLIASWRVAPLLTWGIAWVALSLGPRFVFRSSEFITEPQMYLAMVGISVLIGAIGHALWMWAPPRLTERMT